MSDTPAPSRSMSGKPAPKHIAILAENKRNWLCYREFFGPSEPPSGYLCTQITSIAERLRNERFDCVIADEVGRDATLELIQWFTGELDTPIVVVSKSPSIALSVAAMKAGATDYLPSPDLDGRSLRSAVTEAIERAQRLREQSNSAVELRRRDEEVRTFYHALSHELKTPLTVIQEFVSLVLDEVPGPLNETQHEFLGSALQSCLELGGHINHVLDVSRLLTGKLTLHPSLGRIDNVLRSVVSSFEAQANSRQIRIDLSCPSKMREIEFDEPRISQVLRNLLNNAFKYTRAGSIHVSAAEQVDEDDVGVVRVTVEDTGCGIEPQFLDRVFDRMFQGTNGDAAAFPGLGLGLNVCRDLVDMHGGRMWVVSEPERGTAFHLTIPWVSQMVVPARSIARV